ncbi:hypothetical protein DKX38_024693 [Salix brachista]|uniref:RRM domain-containing protein n=1 Tax=Salix brachista TaxID=2182728 RepID=A0A5N5JQZ1_9ROSI|nr:hypothetical protein DKX38_024693 [Salix brachista]
MTSWQDSKKFNEVHGLHITVLRKTVMTELVQVEKRGEVSIHLDGFMVKALEDLARNVGPRSIFGMVACCCGGDGSGTGGKIVSGCGGSFNRTSSSNIPVGSTHESQEKRGLVVWVFVNYAWIVIIKFLTVMSYSRRSRSSSRDVENPGNNLYVTGLSPRITKKELEKHFAAEGTVIDVHLVVDPLTRESRGFGFVTMSTVKEADRCIKYLDRSVLEGRVITVEKVESSFAVFFISDPGHLHPGYFAFFNLCTNYGCLLVLMKLKVVCFFPLEASVAAEDLIFNELISSICCRLSGGEDELLLLGGHRMMPSHSPRRSPSYSPYRRSWSRSPCYSSERSRSRSYSPHNHQRRSYSPYYYSRRRSNSRTRSPYCRSPVRRRDRSNSTYYSMHRSPDDRYYRAQRSSRRSYSISISPRPRRSSRRSYSPSVSPAPRRSSRRSYSRSVSPRPRKNTRIGHSRDSYSRSCSTSPTSRSVSRSLTPSSGSPSR